MTWFWHDLSHFIAAIGRDDLWWAYGQLELLRCDCVTLVRGRHGVEVQDDAYEKLTKTIPVLELAPLWPTFCELERDAMLRRAFTILAFFREYTPRVAEDKGCAYPLQLERLISDRLHQLRREPR